MKASKIVSMALETDFEVKDITRNMLKNMKGYIYFSRDIKNIEEALNRGCLLIVTDISYTNYRVINVEDYSFAYAKYLHKLYHIKKNFKIIGITGTNGKTTVATLIYNYLNYINKKAFLISTNKVYINKEVIETNNTTPDLHDILVYMKKAHQNKCRYLVMEVSSQALAQNRVFGLSFDTVIFTNFSQDHLDIHHDLKTYQNEKIKLFKNYKYKRAILNIDSSIYGAVYENTYGKVITYGINNKCDYRASDILYDENIMYFKVNDKSYVTNLIGEVNCYNILALICFASKFKLAALKPFLLNQEQICGRLNFFKYRDMLICIDYAHTPYALYSLLMILKNLHYRKITCIIGAGGMRDKNKRRIYGNVLTDLADKIILTNDNPRGEDETKIVLDIEKGIGKDFEIVLDRKAAIRKAINEGVYKEIIAVIGKGAEVYQYIGDETIKYSDIDYIKEIING